MDQLELESLRRLGELDRRRVFARDGHLSTASWLVSRLRIGWGAAKRDVRAARAFERMPITRTAIEGGDLSLAAAHVLVDAQHSDPPAFARSESNLVQAATRHGPRELNRVVWHWRERVMREAGADPDEVLHVRRHLHASTTFMGMVRLDGLLDPESGESLLTAIGAVIDADARRGTPDERTPAQRRADALAEVCRAWLDGAQRPSVAGERPHVNVVVDLATIRRGTPGSGRVEFDHVGPVTGEAARRVACDASVARVVVDGRSEPLDVGRRTAVVPPALRRAVIVRDQTCRFPSCDRPHAWCDAHHIVHWADGGTTALDNLVLLCRRHHRLVHGSRGFRVVIADGAPRFLRADGTTIDDRGPP